ncbi:HU family DNA-binding protein [Bacteroides sp.]|uniref:HU family DNA-binding protein n=1 Tax=Bacteroides sp. TaxID=29523 RepID=UPI002629C598|nr:HU family DNA-binding protein [Bacteroides sp.]
MAYYDLKKKPALTTKEGEKELFYVQAITAGTIPSDEFLELVSKRFGFRKGEIEGVLMSVFDTATDWINKGFAVEVGEFGFFTGKVKGERLVEKKTDIRSQSIRFNDVNFRPSAKFKKTLNGELSRVPTIKFRQSSSLGMDELEKRLMNYLDNNPFINRVTYSELTGRLKWKAAQDLKFFVEKGVIVSRGRGNQKHYVKAVRQVDSDL